MGRLGKSRSSTEQGAVKASQVGLMNDNVLGFLDSELTTANKQTKCE
jgi:hypothetical protein